MINIHGVILGLSIAYAALGVVLLTLFVYARLPWTLKAAAIVVTSAFYVVAYVETRALLGWSSDEALPARFKLLQARIVEPHSVEGEPGAIHLWIEEVGDDNRPSGVPRAYRLPYSAKLADKTDAAVKASANGGPMQGGRTANYGTGEGGVFSTIVRELTLSAFAGGDSGPSGGDAGGGAAVQHDPAEGLDFTPLPPPTLPPKDDP